MRPVGIFLILELLKTRIFPLLPVRQSHFPSSRDLPFHLIQEKDKKKVKKKLTSHFIYSILFLACDR